MRAANTATKRIYGRAVLRLAVKTNEKTIHLEKIKFYAINQLLCIYQIKKHEVNMSISSSELIFLEAAHNDIERVFRNILPLHGHTPREGQISLCHTMLEVLAKGNIALADAGVGVGKTDAYIVAAALLHKYHARCFKNHGLHEIGKGRCPL